MDLPPLGDGLERRGQRLVAARLVCALVRIVLHVEQLVDARLGPVDQLPGSRANAHLRQRRPRREDDDARLAGVREIASLHRRGRLDTEQAEQRRRDVDVSGRQCERAGRAGELRARDDERHVHRPFVDRRVADPSHARAPGAGTVIGGNRDERRVEKILPREPGDEVAEPVVHEAERRPLRGRFGVAIEPPFRR